MHCTHVCVRACLPRRCLLHVLTRSPYACVRVRVCRRLLRVAVAIHAKPKP